MKRTAAALAAAALTVGLTTPAAHAQTNVLGLIGLVNQGVENTDCRTLDAGLNAAGLVGEGTTRNQLVATLNARVGDDATFALISAPTINTIGDRALECGIVQPDPVAPVDQAVKFSSELSSQAGLPELRNLLAAFNF